MAYDYPPSYLAVVRSGTIIGTSTGATLIGASPSGYSFVPLFVVFQAVAVTGLVTVSTVSIGVTATSYNDILGSTLLTGLAGINNLKNISTSTLAAPVPSNTNIYANVSAIAIGSTYNFSISVIGFLQ
jgi:hypothetical protein